MLLLLTTLAGALALGPQGRAALLLDDCTTALADAAGPANDAERVALAVCALETGAPGRALTLAAPVSGDLAPYGRLVEAEARLEQGDWAGAKAALSGVELPGAAGRRAALARGRAALELEDWETARAQLAPLLTGDFGEAGHSPPPHDAQPAEVRWWLAAGAQRRGEPDKAVPVWRRIWVANPNSPRAEQAAARLLTQGKPVPNPASNEGQQLISARADTLERLRLYPEALALRDTLPPKPAVARSPAEAARDAFDAKDYPRAVTLYAALSSPGPSQRFHHALAMSRTGDYAAAAQLYTALYEAFPDHAKGDQASFKVGYLAYDEGSLDRAVPLLRAHLERYPNSKYADEARWFIGWSLFRAGRLDEADAALAALLAANPRSGLAPGATYWRARIAGLKGDAATEADGLRRVARSWPASGYAWFASRRLGTSPPPRPAPAAPPVPEALRSTDFDLGSALAAVGLQTWARDRLLPLEGDARKAGADARLALAHALVAAGAYPSAQALVRDRCGTPGKGALVVQQVCWPRPLGAPLQDATRRYDLPANLPYAIMTAESALKPWVTSIAGARGLMQLMPKLADQHYAEVYAGRQWHIDQLYDPRVNARLGVHELGTLRATFAGRDIDPVLPLVIAGYNAGTAPVERWLEAAGPGVEADVWAENIGYTETRRYVRRVLGYLHTYERVYGAE